MTIFDWFGYELPHTERYRLIKAAGFTGVMLWWGGEPDRDDRDAPERARRAGLFVENVHAPVEGVNSLWRDGQDGGAFTARLLQCVGDCADFEIPTMVMHLSAGAAPPPASELGLDRIRRIADLAERRGMNVALENMRKTEYLDFVLGRLPSPRVGFCYDSGHHHCYTPGDDLLGRYGSRLMALHLHDNDGSDDQHLPPFDGTIPCGHRSCQKSPAPATGVRPRWRWRPPTRGTGICPRRPFCRLRLRGRRNWKKSARGGECGAPTRLYSHCSTISGGFFRRAVL